MSRNFNFSQAANNGVTVLPDLNLGLPAVGNVLSVKATTGGIVTTTFTTPGGTVTGVSSFNTRTGAVTLNSADVTTALTFTPYNATNPLGYQTASQVSTALASYAVPLGGGSMTGPLVLSGLPSSGNDAASKNYVDGKVAAGAVTSFNTRTGSVTLTSLDVTTALTFTPYNATNPANYTTKTYVDGAIAAIPAPPAARNTARLQAQWVTGALVANDTAYLAYDAPYGGTITALTYFTGNGSFTVAIQINGVSVTGLAAVAISSATPATTNATALNTFSPGARITAVITAATGSPTDALLSLAVTWS